MGFRMKESRDSYTVTYEPPSITRVFTATGSNSADTVMNAALAGTPNVEFHTRGALYRQDIRLDAQGYQQYKVTVPYGPAQKGPGDIEWDFDTTGGSLTVRQAFATRSKYAAPGEAAAPDMGGLIGVNEDRVDGAEVVIPAAQMNVRFTHPAGVITIAQFKALARATGKINSAPFMTFAAGEVLFLGASGGDGTDSDATVSYSFACSENLNGEDIGLFANVTKRGWDHFWIKYKPAVEGALPIQKPRWLYVEQVYREIDLAGFLGFG